MIGLHLGKIRVTGLVGMDGARIIGWRMYRDYDRPYKARRATTMAISFGVCQSYNFDT